MFATLAITEMYGPETKVRLAGLYETCDAARTAADARPDYDPSVGCARLAHDQASETDLVVGTATRWDPGCAWDLTTQDEDAAAIAAAHEALGEDFDPNDIPEEYALAAMAENGRHVVQDPDEPRDYYLVEIDADPSDYATPAQDQEEAGYWRPNFSGHPSC